MRWLRVLDVMSNRKRRRIPFALSIRPRGVDVRDLKYASNTTLLTCTCSDYQCRAESTSAAGHGSAPVDSIQHTAHSCLLCCWWMTGQVQHHRIIEGNNFEDSGRNISRCLPFAIASCDSFQAVVKAAALQYICLCRLGRVYFMTNSTHGEYLSMHRHQSARCEEAIHHCEFSGTGSQ